MEQLTGFGQQSNKGDFAQHFFSKEQIVGELDLTSAVREVLTRGNASQHTLSGYDSNPQITASVGKAQEVQLFLQKEFWTYQLLALQECKGVDTKEDRILLQQFNEPKTWLQFFASNIADLALSHNLPYRHGW